MKKVFFIAAAFLFSCKGPNGVQEITILANEMERTAGTRIIDEGVLVHGSGVTSEDGVTVKIPFRDFSVSGRFKNSNKGQTEAPMLKVFIQGQEVTSQSVQDSEFVDYNLGSYSDAGDFLTLILANDGTVRDSTNTIIADVNVTIQSLTFKIN